VARQSLPVVPGPTGLSAGREFVERALFEAGFDQAARYQITMAVNEAVSNAMEHGRPCDDGHFHLAAAVESNRLVFSVRDCGGFDERAAPEPDPVAERGRGFAFMNLLMDDVRLESRPGTTVLRLAKRLPGAPPPAREVEPTAAERNREVVAAVFDALARRDANATLGLVDRGVMVEPLSTPVRRRTPYLGIAGLRRYLDDLDDTWDEFEVTVHELRAAGDYVVALARIHARRENFLADDPASFAIRLREGRITWLKVYRDEADALAAAGLG